jgi:hypothetical protein
MGSKTVQTPYNLVPFPDGTLFSSNTITIDKPIYDSSDIHEDYDHTGTYTVTASSYAGCQSSGCKNDYKPYNVFNGGQTGSWKSNYSGNKNIFKPKVNDYCKDPYLLLPPEGGLTQTVSSVYQGGGSSKTKYVTMVGQTAYNGEWIQISIPVKTPLNLFRYSLMTPDSGDPNRCSYPKSFVLVGSRDGNVWSYIDLQNLSLNNKPDTSSETPIVYDVNILKHYYYYRFIFLEMFPNNNVIEVSQINLYVTTEPTTNRNAVSGFQNMSSYSNYTLSNTLNEDIVYGAPAKKKIDTVALISSESIFSAILFITLVGVICNRITRK